MKKKRIYLSSLKNDVLYLICGWAFIHLIGWLYNSFSGFISSNLLLVTFSATLLLSLTLSNSGKNKNESSFGLPFINSYTQQGENFEFKHNGFNFVIRSLYFTLAMLLILLNLQFEKEWYSAIYAILVLGGIVINYLSNKNDFLRINKHNLSWYDNEQKESFSIDWHLIKKFTVINYVSESNKIDYPAKIIIHTDEKELPINLEKLAILQYSQIIIKILETRIIKAN